MKILFHNVYNSLNENNNLFLNQNSLIGDNLLSPFHKLNDLGTEMGMVLGTFSKVPVEEADAIVFIDYPRKNDPILKYAIDNDIKSYLITLESPIVRPEIFEITLHKVFERVFTWSDKLIAMDKKKYIKINYSYDIRSDFSYNKRDKKIVIIAGNKKSYSEGELYSERMKCIEWFERNDPESMDLYGFHWDLKPFDTSNLLGTLLTKLNTRFRWFKQKLATYKGTVNRKYEILPLYKFCICFENVTGNDGYITEKIFDCFFSGTIPIYKGAPNISKYIPKSCYINYDDFKSIDEMVIHIESLSDDVIKEYQVNIQDFLTSDSIKQFQTETFANTVLNVLSNNHR